MLLKELLMLISQKWLLTEPTLNHFQDFSNTSTIKAVWQIICSLCHRKLLSPAKLRLHGDQRFIGYIGNKMHILNFNLNLDIAYNN